MGDLHALAVAVKLDYRAHEPSNQYGALSSREESNDPLDVSARHSDTLNAWKAEQCKMEYAWVWIDTGAGLRRSEVAALTFAHVQLRDARWVIVDLIGKGNHVRSVPIPAFVKLAIDEWAELAGLEAGYIFRAIHKGGFITHDSMTPQGIRDVVKLYGSQIGAQELAAHDLRRTYAKLARKVGSDMEQIQLSLGHLSIKTTQRYLGTTQDLTDAPGDHLGLTLEGA